MSKLDIFVIRFEEIMNRFEELITEFSILKEQINSLNEQFNNTMKHIVVDELPEKTDENTLYYIPKKKEA